MISVVIDTNDYISALIGKSHRLKLETVLLDERVQVLADLTLLNEIKEVAYRDKFRKYISIEEVDLFIESLKLRLIPVNTLSKVQASPDPDDDFLLALAQDGNADYLLTGDKSDLLALGSFNGISIIRLNSFLDILASQDRLSED